MLGKMASGTRETGGWMGPRSRTNVAKRGRIPVTFLMLPYISPGINLHAKHVPGHCLQTFVIIYSKQYITF
jgi:hypothetical protein